MGNRAFSTLAASFPKHNKKHAQFHLALSYETVNSSVLEVPINLDQKISGIRIPQNANLSQEDKKLMFEHSFTRLAIYKSKKTGKIKHLLLNYVPSIAYLKKHNFKVGHNHITQLDKDFSGYIEYKKWDGTPTHIVMFNNGKRTKAYKLGSSKQAFAGKTSQGKNATVMVEICDTYYDEIWYTTCITVGSYHKCEYTFMGYDETTYCFDDGLTGDPCIDFGDCTEEELCLMYGICDDEEPEAPSISETDIANATVVDDGKQKIEDVKKYIDCFNDSKQAQSYTMTIYVDQPVPGKSDSYKIVVPTGVVFQTVSGDNFDVGHTFVTFEKNNTDGTNVRQTIGFYSSSNPLSSKGIAKDNSGHDADVRYTMNVTENQFNAALQKMESDFDNKDYNLTNLTGNEYNCTDAAISWMNAAGANFGNSSYGLFKNTPGSFGQTLRNMPGANGNPTSGIAGKGPCN